MKIYADLAGLRQWCAAKIGSAVNGLFGWTYVSQSSSLGNADQVQSYDDGLDPESDTKGQRPVTRVQPFGLQSVPPSGLRGLWLRLGSSNVVFIGIGPTQKYGPQSLNAGETAVYSSADGCQVVLDKDGNIAVTATSGKKVNVNGNGDVVVNGGTKAVARVDDTAAASTAMDKWMGQVEGYINGQSAGTVAPLAATFDSAGIAKINSGAANFKG